MIPYRKVAVLDSVDRGKMVQLIARRDDNIERHILLEEEYHYMIKQNKFYVAAQIGSYIKSIQEENRALDLQINMLAGLTIQ